jgi:DNA end-binding protein Ku
MRRLQEIRLPLLRQTRRQESAGALSRMRARPDADDAMAGRAIWKGIVRFGDTQLPIRLLSAVEQPRVRFRLLHREDGVPVEQRWFDPEQEEIVASSDVHKAAVLPDGRMVEITPDDLAQIEPAAARDVEVTSFVPLDSIEPAFFERPYYLGPDSNREDFDALARVLSEKRLAGLARWVMRKKHYLGALTSDGSYLSLITLRSADEVVPADVLPAPSGPPIKKKEFELAKQLVDSLEGDFAPGEFSDMYTERVLELVAERAKKHTVRPFGGKPTRAPDESLEELLSKSLGKKAPRKKVAARRTRGHKTKKRSA